MLILYIKLAVVTTIIPYPFVQARKVYTSIKKVTYINIYIHIYVIYTNIAATVSYIQFEL